MTHPVTLTTEHIPLPAVTDHAAIRLAITKHLNDRATLAVLGEPSDTWWWTVELHLIPAYDTHKVLHPPALSSTLDAICAGIAASRTPWHVDINPTVTDPIDTRDRISRTYALLHLTTNHNDPTCGRCGWQVPA